MSDINSPESFDKDYVKSLREEAAKYRTQLKEIKTQLEEFKSLESQINSVRIENELVRRGVNASPEWIQLNEGQSPAQAVDNFLEKFPQFVVGVSEPEKAEPKKVPKAISPNPNKAANVGLNPVGLLGTRALNEIKQDPVARGSLRDLYRDLLRTSSNQVE
jgi:hypothetical protein